MVVRFLLMLALVASTACRAQEMPSIPDWVVYPDKEWKRLAPEQAGFDAQKLTDLVEKSKPHAGAWGGIKPDENRWGAVLTRGGYLVQTWGDPNYRYQSASLG